MMGKKSGREIIWSSKRKLKWKTSGKLKLITSQVLASRIDLSVVYSASSSISNGFWIIIKYALHDELACLNYVFRCNIVVETVVKGADMIQWFERDFELSGKWRQHFNHKMSDKMWHIWKFALLRHVKRLREWKVSRNIPFPHCLPQPYPKPRISNSITTFRPINA